MLGGRLTRFVIREELNEERTIWQVPQGGVLSPLVYALYTRDIGKGLDSDIQMLQYADDIVMYNMGDGGKKQRISLEKRVEKIRKRLRDLNLDIEPKKIQCMIFRRKGEENGIESKIKVGGEEIENKIEARLFGFTNV